MRDAVTPDMTKLNAIRFLSAQHSDLSFIVNVLTNGCGNVAAKLKVMVELVEAGHELTTASFVMPYEGICVDGAYKTWEVIFREAVWGSK